MTTGTQQNTHLLSALHAALPPERIATSAEAVAPYGGDRTGMWSAPEVVVSPLTAEEVAAVVRVAAHGRVPVVSRGGGTGLAGASVPDRGGILLDLSRMNRIIEIDEANMVAVVQPGVITADLQRDAEALGLFYPPDPQSLETCTVGGNIATGAGGPRCLKYGTTRDYVLGLQVVLPSVEIMRVGGKVLKQQVGYNLAQLFTGSEGTLGVITEATLRLIPATRFRGTLLAIFPRLEAAAETVAAIRRARVVPLVLEMMDNVCIRAVEARRSFGLPLDAETVLLIEQDGNDMGLISADLAKIEAICIEQGALEVRRAADEEEAERLREARRAVSPSVNMLRPNKVSGDLSVPPALIPAMCRRVTEIAAAHRLQIAVWGHIGDGNLHPNIMCDWADEEEMVRVRRAAREIALAAHAMGGAVSGEHGIGLIKRDLLPDTLDPAALSTMRRIKAALDPHNIMNPGKVFPDA
jgi:glycolate oxidase